MRGVKRTRVSADSTSSLAPHPASSVASCESALSTAAWGLEPYANWHFECPFCGGEGYVRVRFPRPDGTYYLAAEIYQCKSCTVMFGDKDVFMKLKDAIVRKDRY